MIEVKNLTRKYGDVTAVNNISFSIPSGEITGLLGPNGAGKTTTLRIIAGYLSPTEGLTFVGGLNVMDNPLKVKRKIGYLPESNPLYEELSVWEYLNWVSSVRGVSSAREVIELCRLKEVAGQDIGYLSKGFRQRVGLAQTLLHDPEVLILDEPTSGLDPNQQREVRELIHSFKGKKTVLVSTHILSEAKSICDRILIISRGQIVADGNPQELETKAGAKMCLRLVIKSPEMEAKDALSAIEGVVTVQILGEEDDAHVFSLELIPSAGKDQRELIFELAAQKHWPILEMRRETASLEDVFHTLTVEDRINA